MKNKLKLTFIVLVIFALAACAKPGEPSNGDKTESTSDTGEKTSENKKEIVAEEGAELIIWGNSEGEEGDWLEYVTEKFTEAYNIPVKIEEVSHTDAPGKLETDGPAGLGGDVFMAPHDHVGNMNTAGLIHENYFAEEYHERFMESAMQGVSLNDEGEVKTYGFPMAIETIALYHNKDLLEEMGFEPAETMDELIEQSKVFAEKNDGAYGFMFEPGNFYNTHAFFGGYGGYIFGEDNTNPDDLGLDNEGAVKSGEFMKKLHDELLPIRKEDITGDVIGSYFDEGKLLYTMTGPWALKGHLEAGVNVGVTTMPILENGVVPTTFSGVKAFFVNSYSDYPQAGTLFSQFATSDEMLLKRYEITNQLPPSLELLENKEIKENEYNIAFLEQATHAISMPNIPEMELVWGGMEVAYTSIWNGSESPQVALEKGTKQIREAIDSQTK